MFMIKEKKQLGDSVVLMTFEAPLIAKKAKPGQFVILRLDELSERIPLTIAGYDSENGSVTVIPGKISGFKIISEAKSIEAAKELCEKAEEYLK